MSIQVDRFLGGFTENAPRPPVPGEENERQSTGGTSTRSSSSHKSQVSAKSHTSQRSDTSVAGTPRRSNLDRSHHDSSSISATTKLQHLSKEEAEAPLGFEPEGSAASSPPFTENVTPPYLKWAEKLELLLNDREGVRLFKQFLDQEHSAQPLDFWFACRGLKIGVQSDDYPKIQSLVKLIYKKYIKGDQLKLRVEVKKGIADKLKKERYEQGIFDNAQQDIEEAMRSDTYPLFLKSDLYVQYVQTGGESPKTMSNTSSGSNSVRPVSGPLATVPEGEELKQEDFKTPKINNTILTLTTDALAATERDRRNQGSFRNQHGTFRKPEGFPVNSKFAHAQSSSSAGGAYNEYHSYAPVSQWESEVQSLSSDALTESDTMSLTDSSVDGREVRGSRKWKKTQKAIRINAIANKHTGLTQQLIPRTDRVLKDRNIAEVDPEKFAALLIERLEQVKAKQEEPERMRDLLKHVEPPIEQLDASKVSAINKSQLNASSLNSSVNMSMLIGMGMDAGAGGGEDDNGQSILDDHVSRIWRDNSQGQTPSRSPPGRHSPDRPPGFNRTHIAGPSPNVSGLLHNSFTGMLNKSMGSALAGASSSGSAHHKRSRDSVGNVSAGNLLASLQSFDSGMGEDRSMLHDGGVGRDGGSSSGGESHHKHIHHYHHHHHYTSKDNKLRHIEHEVSKRGHLSVPGGVIGYQPYGAEGGQRSSKDGGKRSGSKRPSDASSNIDSGIYDLPVTNMPNLRDPANEKVLAWMLENDKVSGGGNTQYSTDNSDRGSSHKRSSHKSSSSSHNKSKKSSSYERSASLDRSLLHHSLNRSTDLSYQPAQPIMQDQSMPLLNPPNPTVQLEEVNRRLQQDEKYLAEVAAAAAQRRQRLHDDRNQHAMAKSKSFTSGLGGGSSKDKQRAASSSSSGAYGGMAAPPVPPRSFPQHIPPPAASSSSSMPGKQHDMSSTEDLSNASFRSERSRSASRKPASSLPQTPAGSGSAPDVTVVGYYLCSEPIPYRSTIHGSNITLAQFKALITKKGNYRYFFKKPSDEFDSGVVYEEVMNDSDILPLCDGKIIGKVDKVE